MRRFIYSSPTYRGGNNQAKKPNNKSRESRAHDFATSHTNGRGAARPPHTARRITAWTYVHMPTFRVITRIESSGNPTASADEPSSNWSWKWMINLYLRFVDLYETMVAG